MGNDQNTRTLIATFKDYSSAKQAAQELENEGFASDQVSIDSNQRTISAGSGGSYQSQEKGTEEKGSGIAGWWNSLFGSDSEDGDRADYEGALASGSTILRATVPSASVDSVAEVLNRYGAVDVHRPSNAAAVQTKGNVIANGAPIQVVQEELQVGKRAVQRGGVRVYSHIVSTPVEEQIRLREERVSVERRTVDREISPEEVSALQDQTIEVTEMGEEAVVAKRARVREEVLVGKEASEHTETLRDNVRHTEVEIEQLGQEEQSTGTASSGKIKATGLSPHPPTPGVMSGGAGTAGSGTLAGETTARFTDDDYTPDYRKNFETSYGSGADFESVRPAYEYGFRSAGETRYKGKSWDQVESNLRSSYETGNPGSSWEKAKGAVRYGWEKVTGKA